jgi:RHS repeat-associated protein
MALENGTSSFYHYDALGSTTELTDASETVTDTYRYNAWGEILARTGTTANPHAYVGKERYYNVPDAVLYLLGLRYYTNGLGRFLTVDPAEAGTNWHEYASNCPAGFTDPSGLMDRGDCLDSLRNDIDAATRRLNEGPPRVYRATSDCDLMVKLLSHWLAGNDCAQYIKNLPTADANILGKGIIGFLTQCQGKFPNCYPQPVPDVSEARNIEDEVLAKLVAAAAAAAAAILAAANAAAGWLENCANEVAPYLEECPIP